MRRPDVGQAEGRIDDHRPYAPRQKHHGSTEIITPSSSETYQRRSVSRCFASAPLCVVGLPPDNAVLGGWCGG